MSTTALVFYLEQGLVFKQINWCAEYQRGFPLKNFVLHVTKKRQEASDRGDKQLATAYKLVINRKVLIFITLLRSGIGKIRAEW